MNLNESECIIWCTSTTSVKNVSAAVICYVIEDYNVTCHSFLKPVMTDVLAIYEHNTVISCAFK